MSLIFGSVRQYIDMRKVRCARDLISYMKLPTTSNALTDATPRRAKSRPCSYLETQSRFALRQLPSFPCFSAILPAQRRNARICAPQLCLPASNFESPSKISVMRMSLAELVRVHRTQDTRPARRSTEGLGERPRSRTEELAQWSLG